MNKPLHSNERQMNNAGMPDVPSGVGRRLLPAEFGRHREGQSHWLIAIALIAACAGIYWATGTFFINSGFRRISGSRICCRMHPLMIKGLEEFTRFLPQ